MSAKSGIEWTNATWNPMVGCTAISPGCDHCYAARDASGRLANSPAYEGLAVRGVFTGEVRLLADRLLQPLAWRAPKRVFVNSMSDAFHSAVPSAYLAEMWAVMACAPQHQFQVLTKRPTHARAVLADPQFKLRMEEALVRLLPGRLPARTTWPLTNVWLGTSIESATWASRRIPALTQTPAAVRFLSVEPLIGPPGDLAPYLRGGDIDWVIVGGESGPGARPMEPEWVQQVLDACRTTNTAFFMKQAGTRLAHRWGMTDRNGHALDEMPKQFRVREYPQPLAVTR